MTAGGLSIGAVLITWGVLKANAPRRDDSIQKLLAEDASLKLIKALKENTAPLTYWITTPTPGSRYEQKIEFIDPQGIRNIIQHDFRIGGNSGALPKKKKIRDWLDSQGYRCTNLPKDQALFSS